MGCKLNAYTAHTSFPTAPSTPLIHPRLVLFSSLLPSSRFSSHLSRLSNHSYFKHSPLSSCPTSLIHVFFLFSPFPFSIFFQSFLHCCPSFPYSYFFSLTVPPSDDFVSLFSSYFFLPSIFSLLFSPPPHPLPIPPVPFPSFRSCTSFSSYSSLSVISLLLFLPLHFPPLAPSFSKLFLSLPLLLAAPAAPGLAAWHDGYSLDRHATSE